MNQKVGPNINYKKPNRSTSPIMKVYENSLPSAGIKSQDRKINTTDHRVNDGDYVQQSIVNIKDKDSGSKSVTNLQRSINVSRNSQLDKLLGQKSQNSQKESSLLGAGKNIIQTQVKNSKDTGLVATKNQFRTKFERDSSVEVRPYQVSKQLNLINQHQKAPTQYQQNIYSKAVKAQLMKGGGQQLTRTNPQVHPLKDPNIRERSKFSLAIDAYLESYDNYQFEKNGQDETRVHENKSFQSIPQQATVINQSQGTISDMVDFNVTLKNKLKIQNQKVALNKHHSVGVQFKNNSNKVNDILGDPRFLDDFGSLRDQPSEISNNRKRYAPASVISKQLDENFRLNQIQTQEQEQILKHATSLELHIAQKINTKLKVEESYFEYNKRLKYQNPLNRFQVIVVAASMIWLILFTILQTVNEFDHETCGAYKDVSIGFGSFLVQFMFFLLIIDFQGIMVRVYIYTIMRKKHSTNDDGETNAEENPNQPLFDFSELNLDNKKEDISKKTTMTCQFIQFTPLMILGILYSYGFAFNLKIEVLVAILSFHENINNIGIFVSMIILIIVHRISILVQFFLICKNVLKTTNDKIQAPIVSQKKLDQALIRAGYINLSNVLYKRITQNQITKKFLFRIFLKEVFYTIVTTILKLYTILDPGFQTSKCKGMQTTLVVSIVFQVICFIRVAFYLGQRSNILTASDDNIELAIDFIKDHFHKNKLSLVINNRNCDLILSHLANFILMSKNQEIENDDQGQSQNAKKLENISVKFECTLYHKLYKEEFMKILLTNASTIVNHSKIREIYIFETVLSNRDFFYIGQVIENVSCIRSIVIQDCLILDDQLFDKKKLLNSQKNKAVVEILKSSQNFDEELINFLKIGLIQRQKNFIKIGQKVPKLDIVLNLMPIQEIVKFSQHICGNYNKVTLVKKRLYDGFNSLLQDFSFLSIQFRIFNIDFNQGSNRAKQARETMASEIMIYDNIDKLYMHKMVMDNRNMIFFTLREVQLIVVNLLKETNTLNLNLMDLPYIFETIQESQMTTKEIKKLDPILDKQINKQMRELQVRLNHAMETETQAMKMRNSLISEKEPGQVKSNQDNIEAIEFCKFVIQSLKSHRLIENLHIRIGDDVKKDELSYFYFEKFFAIKILTILKEISNYCVLKNLTLSSEVFPQSKSKQNIPKNREIFSDLEIAQNVEQTLLSCNHLCCLKIENIMINDLCGFVTCLVNNNNQMQQLEIVNCSHQLRVKEEFLYALQGFDLINLSRNNIMFEDMSQISGLIVMMASNQIVNLSGNPLFKQRLTIDLDKISVQKIIELNCQKVQEKLKSIQLVQFFAIEINLSDTFLGIDQQNFQVFVQTLQYTIGLSRCMLQELNLSGNFIKSFNLEVMTNSFMMSEDIDRQSIQPVNDNFLANLIMTCQSKSLTLNLTGNQLRATDIMQLFVNKVSYKMISQKLKIKLLAKNNYIKLEEFNPLVYQYLSKLMMLDHFVKLIVSQIFDRLKQLLVNEQQKSKSGNQDSTKSLLQTSLENIRSIGDDKQIAEILLIYYIDKDSLNLKPQDKKRHDKADSEVQKSIHNFWKELQRVNYECNFGVFDLITIDFGNQMDLQQEQEYSVSMYSTRILNNLANFLAFISKKQQNLQPLRDRVHSAIMPCQAKYLMKVIDRLAKYKLEFSTFSRRLVNSVLKFQITDFHNLMQLSLHNLRFTEDKILEMIKVINHKNIKLMSLDLTQNKVNTLICKEIAKMVLKLRSLSEIILDNTEIPISGIAFIFQVLVDESIPEENDNQNQTNANNQTNNFETIDAELLDELHVSDTVSLLKDETRSMRNPLGSKKAYIKQIGQPNLAQPPKEMNELGLKLAVLSLKDNKIDFRGFRRLKKKLLFNAQIKQLDLSDNNLGDKGVKYLNEYFHGNKTITHLILKNNSITEKGAFKVIQLLNNCPNLTRINLGGNDNIERIAHVCERRAKKDDLNQQIKYI